MDNTNNTNNLPALSVSVVELSARLNVCEEWAAANRSSNLYPALISANDTHYPIFAATCELAHRFGSRDEVTRIFDAECAKTEKRLAKAARPLNIVRATLAAARAL